MAAVQAAGPLPMITTFSAFSGTAQTPSHFAFKRWIIITTQRHHVHRTRCLGELCRGCPFSAEVRYFRQELRDKFHESTDRRSAGRRRAHGRIFHVWPGSVAAVAARPEAADA